MVMSINILELDHEQQLFVFAVCVCSGLLEEGTAWSYWQRSSECQLIHLHQAHKPAAKVKRFFPLERRFKKERK